MALLEGHIILAQDFINLKARVKAEMLRRNYGSGSVAAYGGAPYDYISTPAENLPIQTEHFNKIITPLNAVNKNTVNTPGVTLDQGFPSLVRAEAAVTNFEKTEMGSDHNDCSASCTGLCVGCTSSCGGKCSHGCRGSCKGGCDTSCKGGCEGKCGSTCTSGCNAYNCVGSCSGGCRTNCHTKCDGRCKGSCEYGNRWT